MCEIGFGWPSAELVSMYNSYLEAFAIGAIGASLLLKALALCLSSEQEWSKILPASVVLSVFFAVFVVYAPVGSIVWLLAQELSGGWMNWCGFWLFFAALAGMAMDLILLRWLFHLNLSSRTTGLLYAANILSLGAGFGLSIWDAVKNPPIA
jgi:hypothetical protein